MDIVININVYGEDVEIEEMEDEVDEVGEVSDEDLDEVEDELKNCGNKDW